MVRQKKTIELRQHSRVAPAVIFLAMGVLLQACTTTSRDSEQSVEIANDGSCVQTITPLERSIQLGHTRKGYIQGDESKSWRLELSRWLKSQDLLNLQGAIEFTDSQGCRHVVAIAVEKEERGALCSRRANVKAEMAARSYMAAEIAAENGDQTSVCKRETETHNADGVKKDVKISISQKQRGVICLYRNDFRHGKTRYYVVVYGIVPGLPCK